MWTSWIGRGRTIQWKMVFESAVRGRQTIILIMRVLSLFRFIEFPVLFEEFPVPLGREFDRKAAGNRALRELKRPIRG